MFRFSAVLVISLFLCLGLTSTVYAGGKFSCDDLADMSHSLNEVADALQSTGKIKAGSDLDNTLNALVSHLFDVANAEKTPKLSGPIKQLDSTWHAQNWKGFKKALDNTINAIADLHDRDCH